jgi:hypothetical protein
MEEGVSKPKGCDDRAVVKVHVPIADARKKFFHYVRDQNVRRDSARHPQKGKEDAKAIRRLFLARERKYPI